MSSHMTATSSNISTEDRLADVIFAIGPNGRYFYNSETAWARYVQLLSFLVSHGSPQLILSNRNRLPKTMETILTTHHVTRVLCCAFGPTTNNWFFSYKERALGGVEKVMVRWGSTCPSSLIAWLLDPATKKLRRDPLRLRVVLGPTDSFAAWEPKAYRWALPESLQTWLTAHGCQHDAPRALSLGHGGEYFVLAKNGAYSFRSTSLKSIDQAGHSWKSVQYITFSACLPKRCIVVYDDTYTAGTIPTTANTRGTSVEDEQEEIDDFRNVLDSYAEDHIQRGYIPQRHNQDAQRAAAALATKIKEEEAKKREEAAKQKAAAAARAEKMRAETLARQAQIRRKAEEEAQKARTATTASKTASTTYQQRQEAETAAAAQKARAQEAAAQKAKAHEVAAQKAKAQAAAAERARAREAAAQARAERNRQIRERKAKKEEARKAKEAEDARKAKAASDRAVQEKARQAKQAEERAAQERARQARQAQEEKAAQERARQAKAAEERAAHERARQAKQAEERAARERARQAKHAEEAAQHRAEQDRLRRAREAKDRWEAAEAERRRPELYRNWVAARTRALDCPPGTLRRQDFPQPPAAVCSCQLPGCVQRKTDKGLRGCKHDMEKLLRASGEYSVGWLRKERLMWHPDRFARRCDEGSREVLVGMATEMFEIYDELIDEG